MTKSDKIWLAGGIPAFIFAILFMLNVFTTDKSIAGKTLFDTGKYTISLEGGYFESFWRNFYKIKKESRSSDLVIKVKSPEDMMYAIANFKVSGVNPDKVNLSGAAFSEVDKYSKGIKFTIRVGSRKNITVRISEK